MVYNDVLKRLILRETELKERIALAQAEFEDISSSINILGEYRCTACGGTGEDKELDPAGSWYSYKCVACDGTGMSK